MADSPTGRPGGVFDTPENRQRWSKIADQGSNDPAYAPDAARMLAAELREASNRVTDPVPRDYLYHGVNQMVARARDIFPEALETFDAQGNLVSGGVPITNTGNTAVPVRVPFNAIIENVWGFAQPRLAELPGGESDDEAALSFLLSCAGDGRDLFSVAWGLNGDTWYQTNGDDELLLPASDVVGTADFPRTMGSRIERKQTISVKFRNITNLWFQAVPEADRPVVVLSEAIIVFNLLNTDPP